MLQTSSVPLKEDKKSHREKGKEKKSFFVVVENSYQEKSE